MLPAPLVPPVIGGRRPGPILIFLGIGLADAAADAAADTAADTAAIMASFTVSDVMVLAFFRFGAGVLAHRLRRRTARGETREGGAA